MEKAVIDRVEDGTAVLLVGDEERELLVPVTLLPSGARPGSWLRVKLDGERVVRIELDEAATESRRTRIQGKMDRLLRRKEQ